MLVGLKTLLNYYHNFVVFNFLKELQEQEINLNCIFVVYDRKI